MPRRAGGSSGTGEAGKGDAGRADAQPRGRPRTPAPEGGACPQAVSPRRARAHSPPRRAEIRPSGRGRPSVPRSPAGEETPRARVPARRGGRGAARPGRAPPQARAPPASSAGGARRELGHCGRRGRARRGVSGKCGGGARGRREVGVPAGAGPVRRAAGSAPAARRSGSHGLSPAAPSTGPHRGGRGARGRRRGPFKGTARRPRARTRRPGARRPAPGGRPGRGEEGAGAGPGAGGGRSAPPPRASSPTPGVGPCVGPEAGAGRGQDRGADPHTLEVWNPRSWGAPSPRRPRQHRDAALCGAAGRSRCAALAATDARRPESGAAEEAAVAGAAGAEPRNS